MEVLTDTKTFYTHLVCSKHGDVYDKNKLQTFSKGKKPLIAKYYLEEHPPSEIIDSTENSMWRYRKVLPVENDENIVTL